MSGNIPKDLVSNILAWLPAKPLLRFRCVSKSWNSLISCHVFISKHIHDSYVSKTLVPPIRILVRHYSGDKNVEVYSVHKNNEAFDVEEDIKITFPFQGLSLDYFRVVGFCNGLLCLLNDINPDLTILWNPLLRKKFILPKPQTRFEIKGLYSDVLGFGYDVESRDFKVVRVSYVEENNVDNWPPIVEIFSLKTRKWRKINNNLHQTWLLYWTHVFVNGKVHWCADQMKLVDEAGNSNSTKVIMAFDLSSEVFEEISPPNSLINSTRISIKSIVYWEKLALVVNDGRSGANIYSIWVMEEYGSKESWIKKFNMESKFTKNVFGFTKGGYLIVRATNEMVLYHPGIEETLSLGTSVAMVSAFAGAYIESLALLIEGEHCKERSECLFKKTGLVSKRKRNSSF